jgi:predicted glycoside hydrolase/deacetylase ChbG (UPF0249 family)
LARKHPQLGIGLHLDLDGFFEVEHGVGRLLRYKDPALPIQAIAESTEAQLKKILKTGLTIGHVDGHHHAHLRPEIFATVAALVSKYNWSNALICGPPIHFLRGGKKSIRVFPATPILIRRCHFARQN